MEFCDSFLFQLLLTSLEIVCSKINSIYIVLRKLNYYFIFSLNLVCLELREGFYYFTLITNLCFLSLTTHSTLLPFLILHELVSYCYYIAYDSKACCIFDHI